MSLRTYITAAALTVLCVSQAAACDEHENSIIHQTKSAKPIIKPVDEMSGEVCFEYRYTSEGNKTQTLGKLRPKGIDSTAGVQDVKPQTDMIREDLTSEKKVVKPKKRKPLKPKPAVQKDAYNEDVKPAATQPVTVEPVQPLTVEQPKTTPIEPVKPEMPKAKEGDAGVTVPAHPSSSVVPSTQGNVAVPSQTSSINTVSPVFSLAPKVANIEYQSTEVDMSPTNFLALSSVVSDLKNTQHLKANIQSYAFSPDGNISEARRVSLQRAIKIRKYLIDNDINASRISVNAIEDSASRKNKVEIQLEETH